MRPFFILLLFWFATSSAHGQCSIPADAQRLAARIHQLAASRDQVVSARQSEARSVSADVGDWFIRTLEHAPSATAKELEGKVAALLSQNSEDDSTRPRVFAQAWGTGTSKRLVVLTYVLDLGCMGSGCSLVRIETFVWEKQTGKARRASESGAALNGRRIEFQLITQYPERDEFWIMASGPMTGWSGRTFGGRAVLYRVNSNEVRPIWDRSLPGLTVQKNELGWEANYADQDRFQMHKPKPYVFDVYALDWQNRSFHRVIHHRY